MTAKKGNEMGAYRCSCGTMCSTEWCPKCGIRNTNKYNASRKNDVTNWSSNDFNSFAAANSYSSSDSSSYSDCSSSDSGGSCGGGD